MATDPISLLSASVVFLFVGTSDVPIGTGFIVGIPVSSRPHTVVPCIVTAKHVVAGHVTINARFTPKAGKPSPRLNVDLVAHRASGDVWEHPDSGVDIVAFRALHSEDAEYTPIPMDLLVTKQSKRKISYWYGARSLREMFYEEDFRRLEKEFPNFTFHIALSEPQAEDQWKGPVGFIHSVVHDRYLAQHEDPSEIEYYLCGPPPMIAAVNAMLYNVGVDKDMIAYDEF